MSRVVILGTIGIDSLETPFGKQDNVIGGSAVYAAYAASFFSPAAIISVKGEDLPAKELDFLKKRDVSLDGVKSEGKNFRWVGKYEYDMNEAKTLNTELNSLANFNPDVPLQYKDAKFIFLGNMDPDIQMKVLNSIRKPELVVLDTMNFWIQHKKEVLLAAIRNIHILIFNEAEARQLFGTPSIVKAAREALKLGPEAVVIKKGEHGSLLFTKEEHFNCPGYPLENVVDPTGCGDSFGGAFIGYYAKTGKIRKAMVYGSVIASFNAEGFGLSSVKKVTMDDIERRFREIVNFRDIR